MTWVPGQRRVSKRIFFVYREGRWAWIRTRASVFYIRCSSSRKPGGNAAMGVFFVFHLITSMFDCATQISFFCIPCFMPGSSWFPVRLSDKRIFPSVQVFHILAGSAAYLSLWLVLWSSWNMASANIYDLAVSFIIFDTGDTTLIFHVKQQSDQTGIRSNTWRGSDCRAACIYINLTVV